MNSRMYDIEKQLEVLRAVVVTGGMILKSYRGKVSNQPKASDLPPDQVRESSTAHTEVDDLVQETSLQILHSHFPEVAVNAEEDTPRLSLFSKDTDGLCFHLDPLDGTLAYTRNRDDFAVGAAFSEERRFVSSAVYFPTMDRVYFASRGTGVSVQDGLGSSQRFNRHAEPEMHYVQKRAERLLPIVEAMNLQPLDLMSAHHSMIAIAEGRAKVLLYKMASPHDFGIPQVIVEEAGGLCTDEKGFEPKYSKDFSRLPWFMAFSDAKAKQEYFRMLEQQGVELGDQ